MLDDDGLYLSLPLYPSIHLFTNDAISSEAGESLRVEDFNGEKLELAECVLVVVCLTHYGPQLSRCGWFRGGTP